MRTGIVAFFLSLLVAGTGCAPTETGNPGLEGSIAPRASSQDPNAVSLKGAGGRVRVDAAWISFSDVRLGACGGPESTILGPITLELLAPPAARLFERSLGAYCTLTTRFVQASHPIPAAAPAQLSANSLVLLGERQDGVPFQLVSDAEPTFALSSPDPGFALTGERADLLLVFDLVAWFATTDLSTAAVGSDGTIRIDANENEALRASFEASVLGSATLHHDLNHDGMYDHATETPIAH